MRRFLRFFRFVLLMLPACGMLAFGPQAYAQKDDVLTVWWNKGYYQEEDQAVRQFVEQWEKKSGKKVQLSFYSTEDLPVKLIAAINTGNVPDVAYGDVDDFYLTPEQAWKGTLVDVSDVIAPVKSEYTQTALQSAFLYNNKEHKRSYYSVPIKQQALHIFYWRTMLEKAGFKDADVPGTWNEFWNFWKKVQDKLRDEGQRVYTMGLPVSSTGTDNYYVFNQLLLAYGVQVVDDKGQLRVDDPKVRQAAIDLVTFLGDLYKGGYIPPGAINWGDADNNAAFSSRQIVMTTNPSLSIPASIFSDKALYDKDLVTQKPPLGLDGKPMRSLVAVKAALIPVGAKHVDMGKDFLRFLTQPKVLNEYLKTSRGRWLPVMPSIIKDDPYWTNKDDPHLPVATEQEVIGATAPWPQMLNPAYAQVNSQQVWGQAVGSVLVGGVKPAAAVDTAIKHIKKIFDNYKIPE